MINEKIEQFLQRNYELGYFIGNVLIARGKSILFTKSYGMSDYEKQIPHISSTPFLIGSVSKQFIAAAIMKLQEEGKLHCDDTIDKYITHYPHASQITIHQLLTHSSGIPNYTETADFYNTKDKILSPDQIIDIIRDKPLSFPPGTSCHYSNSGYVLLAQIIESITGLPYDVYLKQTIFTPLSMNDTGVVTNGLNQAGKTKGYSGTMHGYKETPDWNISSFYGAGAMYSTVEDLYKWDRSLYTDMILSSESRKLLFTKHIGNFGYGWFVTEDGVYHDGRITGFNSIISRYPEEGLVIIILSNRVYFGPRMETITRDIRSILNGNDTALPQQQSSIELQRNTAEKYTGTYMEPTMGVPFTAEYIDGRMVFYDSTAPAYQAELKAITQSDEEDIFTIGMSTGLLSFKKDTDGNVNKLTFSEDGLEIPMEKIKAE
ncbi:serine hydrolase domain-containing protein [Bacillus alkalicellulosilyticus]|uniref:serine hydrolase domain-containing protein n=1 Tax=Alkalihalobacterium alkalicellulosilyticum TaxID=1912214 RepID=UPI00148341B2|nr:serine hydrolase domain-containing protein [Bacillus alkalicellulosilyticus]